MNIILAKEEDKKNFIKVFSDDYFDTEEEAKEFFEEKVGDTLQILKIDEEIVGFISYIYQYSHYANYLEEICVAKGHRGKKYSNKLLNKYIEISREQKTKNTIALSSTDESNITSQKMHENFGFKKIGVLKELHYGKDEIFYSYEL